MAIFYKFPYNYESGATAQFTDSSWNPTAAAVEISDGRSDTRYPSTNVTNPQYLITFTESKEISTIFLVTAGHTLGGFSLTDNARPSTGVTNVTWASITENLGRSVEARDTGTPGTAPRRYTWYKIIPSLRASAVRLGFTGHGAVFNAILTEQILEIDDNNYWTNIRHRRIMEGARRRTNVNGESIVIPGRAGRWKWRTDYTAYFEEQKPPTLELLVSSNGLSLGTTAIRGTPPTGITNPRQPAKLVFTSASRETAVITISGTNIDDDPISSEIVTFADAVEAETTSVFKTITSLSANVSLTVWVEASIPVNSTLNQRVTGEQLRNVFEAYPNFFFYPQPEYSPTIFYPATVNPSSTDIEYLGGLLQQRQISFTVQEL